MSLNSVCLCYCVIVSFCYALNNNSFDKSYILLSAQYICLMDFVVDEIRQNRINDAIFKFKNLTYFHTSIAICWFSISQSTKWIENPRLYPPNKKKTRKMTKTTTQMLFYIKWKFVCVFIACRSVVYEFLLRFFPLS